MRPSRFIRHLPAPHAIARGVSAVAAVGIVGLAAPAHAAPHATLHGGQRDTLSLPNGITLAVIPGSSGSVTVYPSGPVGGVPAIQFQLSRFVHAGPPGCHAYIVGMSITETNGAVVAHKDLSGACSVPKGSAVLSVQPLSNGDLLAACSGKFTQPATTLTRTHAYVAELLWTYQGSSPAPLSPQTVTITSHITCAPGPVVQAVKSVTVQDSIVARVGGFCPGQLAFIGTVDANMSGMANSTLSARWERNDGTTYPASLHAVVGHVQLWSTRQVLTFSNGATGSMRLHMLTPNDVSSAAASYQVHCNPPVAGIVVAAPKTAVQSAAKPVKPAVVKRPPPRPNNPHS